MQAVAGCVAVAVAQVMSCYDRPKKINDWNISWRSMRRPKGENQAAKIIAMLGESDLLDMNYGITESGAYIKYIPRTFVGMGYKEPYVCNQETHESVWRNYLSGDFGSERPYHSYSSPLIMSGQRVDNNTIKGHTWVIDGFRRNAIYLRNPAMLDSENYYLWEYDNTLFHCVWGWGELCNGYYFFDSKHPEFDTTEGADIPTGNKQGTTGSYNYNYAFYITAGFVPEKTDIIRN